MGLALANQLISAAGKPLLPIDNAQLEQMISTGFTVGAALAAWSTQPEEKIVELMKREPGLLRDWDEHYG